MMVLRTQFLHMHADSQSERVINEQIQSIRNFNSEFARVTITINQLNEQSICCQIHYRAKEKITVDIRATRSDAIAAILCAFEFLEKSLERKWARKKNKRSKLHYPLIDDYSDFEEMGEIPYSQSRSLPYESAQE